MRFVCVCLLGCVLCILGCGLAQPAGLPIDAVPILSDPFVSPADPFAVVEDRDPFADAGKPAP